MANEVRVDPNKLGVMQALNSDQILSRDEFMKLMSPATHTDISPPDSLDNLFNTFGIATPKVQQLRKAYTIEQHLDPVYQAYVQSKIPGTTNPGATLGEARSIAGPDFPAPPNAQSYGEAQGPGAPVSTGVYPGQGMTPEQLNTPTAFGTMQDSVNRLSPSGPAFVKEGPRPTTPVPTEDLNALLPRSHQNLLVAKTHQAGLRPYAPQSMLKPDAMERIKAISTGQAQEDYKGELNDLKTFVGIAPKLPGEGTSQGKLAAANASLAEQKANRYAGLTDAQIATMEARQQADKARAKDLTDLLATRQEELQSRITKNLAQGKAAGDLVGLNKEKADVQSARFLLTLHKLQSARDNLDQQSSDEAINELLKLGGSELQLQREEPGFLKGLFGGSGPAHLAPSGLPVPQGQPPSGNPMQFKPGDITSPEQGDIVNPEAITNIQPQAPPEDKKAAAKALYDRMKEGETQTFDGTKYKKQGSKLVPVK
jgi:hypothetical protein